jgi:SAM-dependent methyltransferase
MPSVDVAPPNARARAELVLAPAMGKAINRLMTGKTVVWANAGFATNAALLSRVTLQLEEDADIVAAVNAKRASERADAERTLPWEMPADVEFRCATAAATGLAAGSVDTVFVDHFEGVHNVKAVCREAARILKPGGRLLCALYHLPHSDDHMLDQLSTLANLALSKHNQVIERLDVYGAALGFEINPEDLTLVGSATATANLRLIKEVFGGMHVGLTTDRGLRGVTLSAYWDLAEALWRNSHIPHPFWFPVEVAGWILKDQNAAPATSD